MSKKGKTKGRSISNVKKSNIKQNKLIKAGKAKPKSNPHFVEGGKYRNKTKQGALTPEQLLKRQEYEDEKKKNEKEMFSQLAGMMDPEDLEYLKRNAARGKAFNVPTEEKSNKKRKFEKTEKAADESSGDEDEGFDEYERDAVKRIKAEQENDGNANKRELLPIRSTKGWEQRTMDMNDDPEVSEESDVELDVSAADETEPGSQSKPQKPMSVIEILAKRKELIEEAKIQIGSMATNFLENPEERVFLLDKIMRYMTLGHNDSSVENTVIKLASASVCEILKDIIPNYKILDHEEQDKSVKLKKDTLKLHKYETALLNCVKRFLVKCERIVSEDKNNLAPHAMHCMTELLISHPEFNFTENIIQFSVPYLNNAHHELRSMVKSALDRLFKADKKGSVSFLVVRAINHHLRSKKRAKIREEMLNVLLSLKLYHLENPNEIATAHLNSAKKKREEMSKKERKLAKQRAKLDKELLEAKAEESKETRLKFATDISNLLFAIYFRLIKNPSSGKGGEAAIYTNRNLLRPVLSGLAKFGHLMSIDYFQDLLRVLSDLLERKMEYDEEKNFLGSHESLLCIHTVLSILSGQGEALTLDPQKFYRHLDRIISELKVSEESTYEVASKVLREAFIIRRKKVSKNVLLAAIKQIGVTSLQGGTEILVNFLKDCIQIQPGSVAITLLTKDDDVEVQGSWKNSVLPKVGSADLDVDKDPLIWEISSLVKHCDPQVVKTANQIIGVSKAGPKDLRMPQGFAPEKDSDASSGFVILSI